jgi:hypothetical protein
VYTDFNFRYLQDFKNYVGYFINIVNYVNIQIISIVYLGFTADEDSSSNKDSAPGSRTSTPEPKLVFKDKKEAIEAFKDLLRERVRC